MSGLAGIQVVVTRAAHQAEELAAPLRALGAEVILLPLIAIGPPADPLPLQQAAARYAEYDWVIFTSANAVLSFAAELPAAHRNFPVRVAAIGDATRTAAEQSGFPVSIVPSRYVAESLVEALGAEQWAGKRVLLPSAAIARDVVPQALRDRGATVDVVAAYRNIIPPEARSQVMKLFREPLPDWISFASSSAVDNGVDLIGLALLRRMKLASIGPVTSDSIRGHGLSVAAEAAPHNVAGLVEAIYASTAAAPSNPFA